MIPVVRFITTICRDLCINLRGHFLEDLKRLQGNWIAKSRGRPITGARLLDPVEAGRPAVGPLLRLWIATGRWWCRLRRRRFGPSRRPMSQGEILPGRWALHPCSGNLRNREPHYGEVRMTTTDFALPQPTDGNPTTEHRRVGQSATVRSDWD